MSDTSIYDFFELFIADDESDIFINCYDRHLKLSVVSYISRHGIKYLEDSNKDGLVIKIDFKRSNAISLPLNDDNKSYIKYNLPYDYVALCHVIDDMIIKYPIAASKLDIDNSKKKVFNPKYDPDMYVSENTVMTSEDKEVWRSSIIENGFSEEYADKAIKNYEESINNMLNEYVYGSSVILDAHIYTGVYKSILHLLEKNNIIMSYIKKMELAYTSPTAYLDDNITTENDILIVLTALGYSYVVDSNKVLIEYDQNDIFNWRYAKINIL